MKLTHLFRARALVVNIVVTWLVGCTSPTHPVADRAVVASPSGVESQPGAAPRFAAGGPDAEEYGLRTGYPKGDRTTFWDIGSVVGSHSHLDEISRGRLIHKAPVPSRLVQVAEPRITWTFDGADLTVDDYLSRNPTTGLLIARGDQILLERYQYGRTDADRLTSWCVAPPHLGYGYQTWIVAGERRMFLLWGVRGQRIIVDPQSKLVMVNTAVHKKAVDLAPLREMGAFWGAVVRQVGG